MSLFGPPDRSRGRRRAQRQALRDLRWLMRHGDMRLGQVLSNALAFRSESTAEDQRVDGHFLFYGTDERMAAALASMRRRWKG